MASKRLMLSALSTVLVLVCMAGPAVAQLCEWASGFQPPGMNERVDALTVFDDGTGPALYAGGQFTMAGGVPANYIAKWNGIEWSPLGSGVNRFVRALTVFDDGTGPALYAGGFFTTAGGVPANHIAKWDGSEWSPLGSGMGNVPFPSVHVLTVFDDGTGPALYAGGNFTTAGGMPANRIAKWNGTEWSLLGGGIVGPSYEVHAMTVFDDGAGPALYVGGFFITAGGVAAANHIAKWNGTEWSPLGGGSGMNDAVHAMTVFDDGIGPVLYAGGFFTTAGGVAANRIAKWDGTQWSPLGGGISGGSFPQVRALTAFDDGTGPALYAGGQFTMAGGVAANYIAKWNGTEWSPLGGGMDGRPFLAVYALTVFDDGTGPGLYAGGQFTMAGGVEANYMAKWNGTEWSPLGGGMNNIVSTLTVFDDGTGPALYAGGWFTTAGGVPVNHIAKWDGTQWSPLGGGTNSFVRALTVFDDGTGPALYAAGQFTTAGGVAANRIAKWDGAEWSPLSSGTNNFVLALTVFDDGTGPALYAGGNFTAAGGVEANRTAKWNGAEWSPLGGGMNFSVFALTVFDDGTSPALYAGGDFINAGGRPSSRIAAWRCSMP